MSTITCPAAEIACSTAATYDDCRGKSRSSEVCERNTRHLAPEPPEPATPIPPRPVSTCHHPGSGGGKGAAVPLSTRRGADPG